MNEKVIAITEQLGLVRYYACANRSETDGIVIPSYGADYTQNSMGLSEGAETSDIRIA